MWERGFEGRGSALASFRSVKLFVFQSVEFKSSVDLKFHSNLCPCKLSRFVSTLSSYCNRRVQFHKFLCIYSVREKIYKLSENIGGKVERKKDWLS